MKCAECDADYLEPLGPEDLAPWHERVSPYATKASTLPACPPDLDWTSWDARRYRTGSAEREPCPGTGKMMKVPT